MVTIEDGKVVRVGAVRIAGPNLDDPDVMAPDEVCTACGAGLGQRHDEDCPVRLEAIRLKNLPVPRKPDPQMFSWSSVQIKLNGEPIGEVQDVSFEAIEQCASDSDEAIAKTLLGQSLTNGAEQGSYAGARISFEVDRSEDLLETQTIKGDMVFTPRCLWTDPSHFDRPHGVYAVSHSIPLSKRAAKRFRHLFDPWRAQLLEHVLRGCGPGGRRNSKMSRKILRTADDLAWCEMYGRRIDTNLALEKQRQARTLEEALNAKLALQAAEQGCEAPTIKFETGTQPPVDVRLCAAAVGQGSMLRGDQ
jgi:hypothetical protein